MNWDRLSVLSLLGAGAFAAGVLLLGSWVRQNDLERLAEQNARNIEELAVLHEAVCNMRIGYQERQALFGQFLSRPYPGGPTKQLVVALKGSFAETLFALRTIDCGPGRLGG